MISVFRHFFLFTTAFLSRAQGQQAQQQLKYAKESSKQFDEWKNAVDEAVDTLQKNIAAELLVIQEKLARACTRDDLLKDDEEWAQVMAHAKSCMEAEVARGESRLSKAAETHLTGMRTGMRSLVKVAMDLDELWKDNNALKSRVDERVRAMDLFLRREVAKANVEKQHFALA